MPLFCKLTNHPNYHLGNCYLHDIDFRGFTFPANYPDHNPIDPLTQLRIVTPNVLTPNTNEIPHDYIELHSKKKHLNSFTKRMTTTEVEFTNPKYCVLHQGIGKETKVITHLVKCISTKVGAKYRLTDDDKFIYAVECQLIAYLDPIQLGAIHNTNGHHWTEHQINPKHSNLKEVIKMHDFDPEFHVQTGCVYHFPSNTTDTELLDRLKNNKLYKHISP
jgi:hypothetical protein